MIDQFPEHTGGKIKLINSFSDFHDLDNDKRKAILETVADYINSKNGKIVVPQEVRLYMAIYYDANSDDYNRLSSFRIKNSEYIAENTAWSYQRFVDWKYSYYDFLNGNLLKSAQL